MEKLLNYMKTLGYFIVSLLILSLVLSLINLITPISSGALTILSTISLMVIYFIIGFKRGKVTSSKGWWCGIKNGLILCLTLLLISLIFFTKNIKLSTFIYYGILILVTIFGSIIGINKKKES